MTPDRAPKTRRSPAARPSWRSIRRTAGSWPSWWGARGGRSSCRGRSWSSARLAPAGLAPPVAAADRRGSAENAIAGGVGADPTAPSMAPSPSPGPVE